MTFRFDEVAFELPAGSTQEAADIEAAFADWWEYGAQDHNTKPVQNVSDPLPGSGVLSLKEVTQVLTAIAAKNAELEECLLEMSEVIYA